MLNFVVNLPLMMKSTLPYERLPLNTNYRNHLYCQPVTAPKFTDLQKMQICFVSYSAHKQPALMKPFAILLT